MITRLLLLLTAAAGCLCAQFQLYVVNGPAQTAVGAQFDMGTLAPGASKDVVFRLKNSGTAAAVLTMLSAEGVGFSIPEPPTLPKTVAAGGGIDFTVHFAPTGSGFFSAVLTADGVSVILVGTEAAGAARGTVYLAQTDGSRLPLNPGDTVDFGSIPRKATAERDFLIVNETAAPMTILNVALAGSFLGHRGFAYAPAPVNARSRRARSTWTSPRTSSTISPRRKSAAYSVCTPCSR